MKLGRCEFCIFFVYGTCRARAPIGVLEPGATRTDANNVRVVERWNLETRWPAVGANDGCGQFELDATR